MTRNIILIIVLLGVFGVGAYLFLQGDREGTEVPNNEGELSETENEPEENEADLTEEVAVYVTKLEAGEIGCGDAIVPVTRSISPTQAALQAALTELFSLPDNEFGPNLDHYNALSGSSLTLDSVDINAGAATVDISGSVSVGGVCDEPRFVEQIKKTVMQFPTVTQANISINGVDLDDLFAQ